MGDESSDGPCDGCRDCCGFDTVISVSNADGSVSITPAGMEMHQRSAKEQIDSWLLKAEAAKDLVSRIDLGKESKILMKARFAVKHKQMLAKGYKMPLAIGLVYVLVKGMMVFFGALTANIAGMVKDAQKKSEPLFVFIRIFEDLSFGESFVAAGLTAQNLEKGYEFKGEDKTGAYRQITDLGEKTFEWTFPDNLKVKELDKILFFDAVKRFNTGAAQAVFPMAVLRCLVVALRASGIEFRAFLMHEDEVGRLIVPMDKETLERLTAPQK